MNRRPDQTWFYASVLLANVAILGWVVLSILPVIQRLAALKAAF